jgi:phosphoglycolate phosphatase
METNTAIIFDLDGTIADTRPDLVAALNACLRPRGFRQVEVEEIGHSAGQGSLAMIDAACRIQDRMLSQDERLAAQRQFLSHYEKNIAVETRLFPGITQTMDHISALGMELAVCTNKPERLALQLLDALGMRGRFAAISGGDTFGFRKPDGRHLTATLERTVSCRGLMVGDTVTDLDAARSAKMPVILVDFGYSNVRVETLGADAIIGDFDQLAGEIERLLGTTNPA